MGILNEILNLRNSPLFQDVQVTKDIRFLIATNMEVELNNSQISASTIVKKTHNNI